MNKWPKSWTSSPGGLEQVKFYDSLLSKHICESEILMIGTGFTSDQYYVWPKTLEGLGAKSITYLEIWEPYIELWKNKKYPIIKGDVSKISDTFKEKSFDIVLWLQGPEHVKKDIMKNCFIEIAKVSRKLMMCSCPWGTYYDGQEDIHGNPFEKHIQKGMMIEDFIGIEPDFNVKTLGACNGGNGVIVIWKEI